MEPINRKIQSLVDMFLLRELLLPEMQRKYVWRATQVRDLIDSIYRDYPSGSILIWETSTLPKLKDPAFGMVDEKPIAKQLLLLDGQQRVTSLASVLTGKPIRIKEGTKIKERNIEIYFNIDHPDDFTGQNDEEHVLGIGDIVEAKWEADGEFYIGKISEVNGQKYYILFDDGDEGWSDDVRSLGQEKRKELFFRLGNKTIKNKEHWISVTKLFQKGVGKIIQDLKISYDHPNFRKFNDRLNMLYSRKDNYLYPIQIIREKSYAEVTDVFIRVNSSGVRLRGSDLALAQITSVWPGAISLLEQFIDECIQKSFFLDENFLVRCIVCIATSQAKFDNISRLTPAHLEAAWELVKIGTRNSINFLKNNAYIDSTALLPSYFLLIPLIYYSSKSEMCATPDTEEKIIRWLYNAAIWGRYSGSSESRLSEDLSCFKENNHWEALHKNTLKAAGNNGRLTAEDILNKGVNSPIFFMMYVAARKRQARDLSLGTVVNYTNFGRNNHVEFDHIFPKSKLDKHFIKLQIDANERKKAINQVANLAFMTKKGNIIKRDDDPSTYFPKVHTKYGGTDFFSRQLIPYDPLLLDYEKYELFICRRAELIASAINGLLTDVE